MDVSSSFTHQGTVSQYAPYFALLKRAFVILGSYLQLGKDFRSRKLKEG